MYVFTDAETEDVDTGFRLILSATLLHDVSPFHESGAVLRLDQVSGLGSGSTLCFSILNIT